MGGNFAAVVLFALMWAALAGFFLVVARFVWTHERRGARDGEPKAASEDEPEAAESGPRFILGL